MSPIQQMLLGVGAVADKTYVDDVFNTRVYRGDNSSSTAYVNGLDNSTEGGLLWVKARTASMTLRHYLHDTVRGAGKRLNSDGSDSESTANGDVTSFNSNGYTLGNGAATNSTQDDYVAWNFRRAPGFFDIVTWSGNGSTRTIAHNLGAIPGCIMVKRTDSSGQWRVYHRGVNGGINPEQYCLKLDSSDQAEAPGFVTQTFWNNTAPTSSVFTVGTHNDVNSGTGSYVAYLFADGSSKEATSRSVDFDGSSDYLLSTSSDYSPGTGDFTMEAWVNIDAMSGGNQTNGIYQLSSTSGAFTYGGIALLYKNSSNENRWELYGGNTTNKSESTAFTGYQFGEWVHTAIVKTSSTIKLYINGEERISDSDTQNYSSHQYLGLGSAFSTGHSFDGKISNFKLTIGQALYTSNFTPTKEPLTTTSQSSTASNVEILCCNNSSVTGKTVGATITSSGTVTASTENPNFIEPAANIFGKSGAESVIKCAVYKGNGNSSPNFIYTGFEPQWIMIKATDSGSWWLYDTMRDTAWPSSNEQYSEGKLLYADSNTSEDSTFTIRVTATGWYAPYANGGNNQNNDEFVYVAVRRSDGYVGKPPELGTGVFAMDYGNASSTSSIATYDSGFPVDFSIRRQPATSQSWYAGLRLTGTKSVTTDTSDAEVSDSNLTWDRNDGVGKWSGDLSSYLMWQWKRHAGFDVVADEGDGQVTKKIAHSLNAVPQMIWRKNRDGGSDNWQCYHFGVNGGTNPHLYRLRLNTNNAQDSDSYTWVNAPTATHFTVGSNGSINRDNDYFITMLFTSVTGISKCGFYDGSNSSQTISTGFAPRFLIVKKYSGNPNTNWYVIDTLRGWGSGDDKYLELSTNAAQADHDFGAPTSTGMTLPGGEEAFNASGSSYIYYAHA